ncbi:CoA ester lyase [Sphingomonas sp.]|uniref:HpcH/HpaI aldolase/citrate lyase family protein n=1 Tax=Sphingomonas sp. TaxID=28214 RepID=UPI001ED366F0|nr:CoA ester lyase [Sphingomonas sp.]MBX3593939.1 CoA ester lyase [Sphingomonas sp.]
MSARRPLRSMLFIPGDSEKKMGKIAACGADAVILDLEDSVAPENKDGARQLVRDYLRAHPAGARGPQLWVRINPFDTGLTLADLTAVMAGQPDGILQPKIDGPADVARLSHYLDAFEAANGIAAGATAIIPVATETATAPFHLGEFAKTSLPRLAGLTWGAEDLAAAIGASGNRAADGGWAFTFRMARSLCLLAAHAAGVPAIETLYADFRDEDGLRASCREARGEGFGGRLAIHPAQVASINSGFTPDEDEIAHARRVVDAFASAPGVGTIGIDGKMYDIPHLKAAQRVLDQAGAFGVN